MRKDELESMKREYDNLEIPEELSRKVEQSMKQAKQDNERERVMRRFQKPLKYGIVAMLAITVLTNSSEQMAYAMAEVPVLGAISKVVTFRSYEKKDGTMQAKIDTPKVEGEKDSIKDLNQQMEEYTKIIQENFESDLQAVLDADGNAENGHEAVDTTSNVVCDNHDLLSIQISTTVSMGGSTNFSKCYTLDKKTGKILELKDFFKEDAPYQTVISEEIIRQMREQMKADESKSYFIDVEDMGEDFNFKQIKENQNFYIDENGKLNIAFDEYEVAPGYMGMCNFVIEKEAIQDILPETTVLK